MLDGCGVRSYSTTPSQISHPKHTSRRTFQNFFSTLLFELNISICSLFTTGEIYIINPLQGEERNTPNHPNVTHEGIQRDLQKISRMWAYVAPNDSQRTCGVDLIDFLMGLIQGKLFEPNCSGKSCSITDHHNR